MRALRVQLEPDAVTYREPRDSKATSRCLLRLEFLEQPAAVRQDTRARIQTIINHEMRWGRSRPSELAVNLAAGMYDEPKAGELDALRERLRTG